MFSFARVSPGRSQSEREPPANAAASRFVRLLAHQPLAVVVVELLLCAALLAMGFPPIQKEFEGFDARSSLVARSADAFTAARDQARQYMAASGGDVGGRVDAALSSELLDYRTLFFFHSASGDILSEQNMNSTTKVLNAAVDILSPNFCYKGVGLAARKRVETASQCQPPWTLMSIFNAYSEGGLKALIREKDFVLGLGPFLRVFLSADLNVSSGRASWMQGHVRLGAPLAGFDNASHNMSDQRARYDSQFERRGLLGPEPLTGGWIAQFDAIIAREEKANKDLRIYYGGRLLYPRIFSYVNRDIAYSVVSVSLVALCMWLHLGSLWLMAMGMLSIVMSLGLGLATWKVLGFKTFTFMQAMCIYIMLGIGADNIFVFADSWKQSRALEPGMSGDIEARLCRSWGRAKRAMTVTSLTTACAFILTSFADVPAVSTFGTFAALVVGWGYVLSITWLPAWVVVYERHIAQCGWKARGVNDSSCLNPRRPRQRADGDKEIVDAPAGCSRRVKQATWSHTSCEGSQLPDGSRTLQCTECGKVMAETALFCSACGAQIQERRESVGSAGEGAEEDTSAHGQTSPGKSESEGAGTAEADGDRAKQRRGLLEHCFHTYASSLIVNPEVRISVLVVMPMVALLGVVLACSHVRLTTKPTTEAILKKHHPLQKTFDLLLGADPAFQAGSDREKQLGHWAYGLDAKDPMDRSGTDALGNGVDGARLSFAESRGQPRFARGNLSEEAFQVKLVQDCGKMSTLSSVSVSAETGSAEVFCFMRDFKAYTQARGRAFPVPATSLAPLLHAWQTDMDCEGIGCYKNRRGTGVTQGRENTDMYISGTGFLVEGGTLIFAYIGANLSVPKSSMDMSVVKPELRQWRSAAQAASQVVGGDVVGVTGRALWIATMDALVECVVQAVPTSIGLSFTIVAVTTANWFVAAMATITIMGVMGSFFLTFVAQSHTLGLYEALFLSITAGLAVDYVVHLAHAYNESAELRRADKMRDAMTTIGVSVVAGAVSTLMASFMVLLCSFNFLATYGSFVFFVIAWSLVWALVFFPALMMTWGPERARGDITLLPWSVSNRQARHDGRQDEEIDEHDKGADECNEQNYMSAESPGTSVSPARVAPCVDRDGDETETVSREVKPGSFAGSKRRKRVGFVILCAVAAFIVVLAVVNSCRMQSILDPRLQSLSGDNVTFQTLLQGARIRLSHVGIDGVCTNPMRLSMRMQVTNRALRNPANFYISLSKLDVFLRRIEHTDVEMGSGMEGERRGGRGTRRNASLIHVNLSEAAVLSGEVEESDLAMKVLVMTKENVSSVARAIADIQYDRNLSRYALDYEGELTIRIVADRPIYYSFNHSSRLHDIMDEGKHSWTGLVQSALGSLLTEADIDTDQAAEHLGGPASDDSCVVVRSCWFTSFKGECCANQVNLSGSILRSVNVRDTSGAFIVAMESSIMSPLLSLGTPPPSLNACIVLQNTSDSQKSNDSYARRPSAPVASVSVAPTDGDFASVKLELLPAFVDWLPALVSALRQQEDSRRLSALIKLTETSHHCHLQRLLSLVDVPIDLSSLIPARDRRRSRARRAAVSPVDLPSEFSYFLPDDGGGNGDAWFSGDGLTRDDIAVDFSFASFEERDPRRAVMTLKFNNVLLCPVAFDTGQYVVRVAASAPGAALGYPAMTVALLPKQEEVASRNTLTLALNLTFDNSTLVGTQLLSPALTGHPFRVFAVLDTGLSTNTVMSRVLQRYLSACLPMGLQVNRMAQAPVVLATQILDKLDVSSVGSDALTMSFVYEITVPGARVIVPFAVPPVSLTLTDPDGVDTLEAVFELDINFWRIKVSLDANIKLAGTRCNPLLSAIAFSSAAHLSGRLQIGSVLDPFPVLLRISAGMWGAASVFEAGSARFTGAAVGHDGAGRCGISSGQVSSVLCNTYSSTVRANLVSLSGHVVAASRENSPIAAQVALLRDGDSSKPLGECARVGATFAGGSGVWAASAAQNASCMSYAQSGDDALALGFPELTLTNLCTCKDGIGKCSTTDGDSEWKCNAAEQQLKLCLDPS